MTAPLDASRPARIEFILIIILLIFSWLTVGLRLWTRTKMTKSLGWDDAAMAFTLLLFTILCAVICVIIFDGTFSPGVTQDIIAKAMVYVLLGELFYILTTVFLKIALGLFFLRIVVAKWQIYTFYTIMGVSTLFGTIHFLAALFQCGTPDKFIEHQMSGHGCISNTTVLAFLYTWAGISIVADWAFVIVSLFVLRETTMNTRTKIPVAIIMVLAALGSIGTILRVPYITGTSYSNDFFTRVANNTIWSTVETGTGIIAGSLATLRPLFNRLLDSARSTLATYGITAPSLSLSGNGDDGARSASNKYSSHRTRSMVWDDEDEERMIRMRERAAQKEGIGVEVKDLNSTVSVSELGSTKSGMR